MPRISPTSRSRRRSPGTFVVAGTFPVHLCLTVVTVVRPQGSAGRDASSADPRHAEACERETSLPRSGPVVKASIARLENGNYRTTLELRLGSPFDAFWHAASFDPHLASPAGKRVFQIRREPLKLELGESTTRGAQIGKTYHSYAYLTDKQVQAASTDHPVTGRYPLSAASMVTQVNGDHVADGSHLTAEGRGQAVDLQAPEGTEVVAFGAGTVVVAESRFDDKLRCVRGHSNEYANVVAVLQDDGYEALYGHLKQGSTLVTTGTRVVKGQPLASLGEFNASEVGSHLHFQLGGMTEAGLVSVPVAFEDAKESRAPAASARYGCEAPLDASRVNIWPGVPNLHGVPEGSRGN